VAKSAERIHLDDFVFELYAAIPIPQGLQLVKVESRETVSLNAPNIAAASFDPQNRAFSAVEWIGFLNFRTGVSTAKICDSKIGAQYVGAIAQEFRRIELSSEVLIPSIFEIAKSFLNLHQQVPLEMA